MAFTPKDYVPVSDRLKLFKDEHGEAGTIETELVACTEKVIVFKTLLKVNGTLVSTGHGSTVDFEDKGPEKAETVSLGRALANAGYEIRSGIASAEEMADFNKSKSKSKSGGLSKLGGLKSKKKATIEEVKAEEAVTTEGDSELDDIASKYTSKEKTTSKLRGLRR